MCGGSPLSNYFLPVLLGVPDFTCRGDNTGEEMKFYTLVLPSVKDFLFFVFCFLDLYSCRGDYTGENRCYTLVLPSVFFLVLFVKM